MEAQTRRESIMSTTLSFYSITTKKNILKSLPPIMFMDEDFEGKEKSHNDPIVVKVEVANFLVCKVLID